MIIAATGYFRVVDTVGIRVTGKISDPIPQRMVLRATERPRQYTVGVQRQDESIIRGARCYATLDKAWADFEEYTTELIEDGYVNSGPTLKLEGSQFVIERK